MFRTLLIVAAVALVVMLVRSRLQRDGRAPQKNRKENAGSMLKCAQCGTCIPEKEAIITEHGSFCCRQHHRDWQAHQHRD